MAETPTHDFAAHDLARLLDRRECAALNCVNAIQFVLSVFEAQEYSLAKQMLQDALDHYKACDTAITEFHRTHALDLRSQSKKENSICHSVQQPKKLVS